MRINVKSEVWSEKGQVLLVDRGCRDQHRTRQI